MRKLHYFDREKNMALSDKIRQLRESLGYTQTDIAQQLKVSASYYSGLENRPLHMSIDALVKVSAILKTSVFELVAYLLPIETRNEVILMARMLTESIQPGTIIKGFLTITSKTDKSNV